MMTNTDFDALMDLYRGGQYELAITSARSLISQYPNYSGLNFVIGQSLTRLKRHEEAIDAFQREIGLDRQNKQAWNGLIYCLVCLNRTDLAFNTAKAFWQTCKGMSAGQILINLALPFDGQDELIKTVFWETHPYRLRESPGLDIAIAERNTLKAWCETHQAEYFELEPAHDMDLIEEVNGEHVRYRSSPIIVATIRHGRSTCGWDFVIAPTGEVLEDTGYSQITTAYHFMPHERSQFCNKVVYIKSTETIEVDEDVLFLSCSEQFVFGHWVLDFLPRLIAWRLPGRKPLKIFCPANMPQHNEDTLKLFGVQKEDLIEGVLGQHYRFRSLTIVRFNMAEPPLRLVEFLYKSLGPGVLPPSPEPEAIVFLERSQTTRGRLVENKDELDAVLKDFGAMTMRRPEVSVAEQNAIFARTGIVIGVFGSDLLAKFQLRPHTDIIIFFFSDELSGGPGLDVPFLRVCTALQVRVHKIYSPAAPSETKKDYRRDMRVDCQQLRAKLTEILATRKTRQWQ